MKKKRAPDRKAKSAPAPPLPLEVAEAKVPLREGPTPLLSANAVATGVLLGAMQWSVFFLLQSYLASTAVVYLLATVVWLAGSVAGMALPGRREPLFLAVAVASFYLLRAAATAHPYKLAWLPLLLLFVAGMGAYAGRFFRLRAAVFPKAKWLFFLENTGFVTGMLATALALFWMGDTWFSVAPISLALITVATGKDVIFARS